MESKKQVIRYVLLLASLVMLISVILPHHHHSNGMPCCKPLTEAHHATNSPGSQGCEGHNLASFTSFHSDQTDLASLHYLFPLFILYDYIYPPQPAFVEQLFGRERAVYIESLHDTWIAAASGLRAPPSV